MSRRIFLQAGAPAAVLGLTLLGVCLAGVWSIGRLHSNLARILSENAASVEAAQELEIQLRHVRLHALLYVADPTPDRRALVEDDHRAFEAALAQAQAAANLPDEQRLVAEIQAGYRRYREELDRGGTFHDKQFSRDDFLAWADAHPIRHLAAPCHELSRVNKEAMEQTARESEALSARARWGLFLLGLAGSAGGVLAGVGIARGLRRSVARLEVRVQDVRSELDREVASVRLPSGGGLTHLEHQLDAVVAQVREVVAQTHRQQQEAMRAEQLAAVGRLAASVAHEVRNPLTAIKMLVSAALRGRAGQALTADDLRVIQGEVDRLEQTVQHLLDLARPPELRRQSADLRDVAAEALGAVRVRAGQQGVEVCVRQPGEPLVGEVDRGQFRAVLVNLFLNALDAMPKGGRLEVCLEAAGAGARVAVRDSGEGIAPEVACRLFTPFVSSKPTGTGQGLVVCRRVMQQHGGGITGGNRPGGGAEFVLTLPNAPKMG